MEKSINYYVYQRLRITDYGSQITYMKIVIWSSYGIIHKAEPNWQRKKTSNANHFAYFIYRKRIVCNIVETKKNNI